MFFCNTNETQKVHKWGFIERRQGMPNLLVLDIDGTLLSTTVETKLVITGNQPNSIVYHTFGVSVYRKGMFSMLIQAYDYCNIIVYTAGITDYARNIANKINSQIALLS